MARSLLFFAFLLFGVSGKISAQHVKPVFKDFTYVSYHTAAAKGITHVVIENYIHISSDGTARYVSVIYDNDTYSGNTSDTIYKLNDTTIAAFNKVFDGKTTLKSHIVTTKLPDGAHYAGPYECIIYTDRYGKTDHLLFIGDFLDQSLNQFVNNVIDYMPSAAVITRPPYHNPLVETKIAAWYKVCNCMPKIEAPPSVVQVLPGM